MVPCFYNYCLQGPPTECTQNVFSNYLIQCFGMFSDDNFLHFDPFSMRFHEFFFQRLSHKTYVFMKVFKIYVASNDANTISGMILPKM